MDLRLFIIWWSFGSGAMFMVIMWFINVYIKASNQMMLQDRSLSWSEFLKYRGCCGELASVAPKLLHERHRALLTGAGVAVVWLGSLAAILLLK